ncbi:High-affinity Na(+)/H(+) antiporter NhaS3 [compost metagenome]
MSSHLGLIILLSLLAIATKLIGSALGARAAGFNWRSAMAIGSAMVSRGEVALIIAAIGLESGLLSPEMMTVLVIVVLITTMVTPLLMKLFFKERREDKFQGVTERN